MSLLNHPRSECSCTTCTAACRHRPGWFLPGEAEKAAAHLGMTFKEFFNKHLAVDWFGSEEDIFLLAPALANEDPGEIYPIDPRGICGLFVGGKCLIHEAKPKECAAYHHGMSYRDSRDLHYAIGRTWMDHQEVIRTLMGRMPTAPEPTHRNFGWLFL